MNDVGGCFAFGKLFDFCGQRGDSVFGFGNLNGAELFDGRDFAFDLDSKGVEMSGGDFITGEVGVFKFCGGFACGDIGKEAVFDMGKERGAIM